MIGLILASFFATALADPCGLVPPLDPDTSRALVQRVGTEYTYVFYRDGVETIAIRPAFWGEAAQFGMLVPLPSPPEVHKVPDDVFAHLRAAVDPPVVSLGMEGTLPSWQHWARGATNPNIAGGAFNESSHATVRVLDEEAVGMYELAVLEAGSAAALRGWMEAHGFQYPDGMDAVVDEYVAAQWAFVAVKARVSEVEPLSPRPGMRKAEARWSANEVFEGAVQAMAFRFAADEPIVPMRLSTFNDGSAHNIVYFVGPEPIRFAGLPTDLVVRQVDGPTLQAHLANPLDLRVYGSGVLEPAQQARVDAARDADPYVGIARDLIASDLRASATGALSLEHEERAKELLRLSERVGMRGAAIDGLHRAALQADLAALAAIDELAPMALTVMDGWFPQDVLRQADLTVEPYTMPADANADHVYSGTPVSWIHFTVEAGALEGPRFY